MMEAEKTSKMRIALALLCGLALCGSIMYITAESEEYVHEEKNIAVESIDVLKAGDIISETPHGRQRFMDYFNSVETEIANEVANRRADMESVRAQMARDYAFNAASRAKLKRDMLHNMAVNAKIARDHLNHAMRRCQERFAKQARLANRRYRATLRRDRRTKRYIEADRREAARNLQLATTAWTKTTNAWGALTNARIDKLNTHAAANAAQIQENAKKARKDLEGAMGEWDAKVNHFSRSSKNARDKLSAQFAAQSKATRAWANNKIKGLVASTAAQFNDVETKMAKNRHEVDMALRQASQRFYSVLNAQKALDDKRFAQSQANIKALREETAHKVDAASSEFKVSLLTLGATVREQVSKVNNRIDDAAGIVRSDAAAQAKVNANVNAEMTRMIKLGNDREQKHLKRDVELQGIINKNKEAVDKKLNGIAADFNNKLAKVRKQLKKDRKHAEDKLTTETQKVYAKLKENMDEQAKKNAHMKAETTRIRLDQIDAIRNAKEAFKKKIKDLGKVVAKNDEKASKKIFDLTKVVRKNAAKSKKGRQVLHDLETANKKELKKAIADAIAQGEKRAKAVEQYGEKLDKQTKTKINGRLNAEITKLRDETDSSIEQLQLQSKEARQEMKKEMLLAVRGAAETAQADLQIAIKDSVKKMEDFQKRSKAAHGKSKLERKALRDEIEGNKREVSRTIRDAVALDAKAQTALRQETAKKLKKTNTKVDAYAEQMRVIAQKSRDKIKETTTSVLGQIRKEKDRVKKALKTLKSNDEERQKEVLDFLAEQVKKAEKDSDTKFGKAYDKLAADRAEGDRKLAASIKGLNDALAAQAALEDVRFKDSVKNLEDARKQAAKQVEDMRKDFATAMVATTAKAKQVETKLADNIAVVSGEVINMKAFQTRVNRRVKKEKERILKLSNDRHSESKRARGKLRQLIDANKKLAADETAALAKDLDGKISKVRAKNAVNKLEMAKDLTDATEKFYETLATQQKADILASQELNAATEAARVTAAGNLKTAKAGFASRLTQLTDTVAANLKTAESEITRITGVAHDYNKAAAKDRGLIKDSVKALEADLNKALNRAIAIGEAKAKAVEDRLALHLKNTKRVLQIELSERVEAASDKVFKMVEGKRSKIADNYLSLKAYAITSQDKVQDYVGKGKGTGLSSIGDLLQSVGLLGAVRAKRRQGIGAGESEVPAIFSGKTVKVSSAVSVVNGLVDEYTTQTNQVRLRWPMGLGKYLLEKLEASMYKKGVLQVGKVAGRSGQHVFVNGHSIGLSNKLGDLQKLAVRLAHYEGTLAKLTSKIALAKPVSKPASVPPPEWQGD
jgi:hypothetical protein